MWFSGSRSERYTIEGLRDQIEILSNNCVLNHQNSGRIMDALQEIVELLAWDQSNSPSRGFFEIFMEKGVPAYMLGLLKTLLKYNRGEVFMVNHVGHLLKILTILFENIVNLQNRYMLFSNNLVNDIILCGSVLCDYSADYKYEECMGFYVTLLKTVLLCNLTLYYYR